MTLFPEEGNIGIGLGDACGGGGSAMGMTMGAVGGGSCGR